MVKSTLPVNWIMCNPWEDCSFVHKIVTVCAAQCNYCEFILPFEYLFSFKTYFIRNGMCISHVTHMKIIALKPSSFFFLRCTLDKTMHLPLGMFLSLRQVVWNHIISNCSFLHAIISPDSSDQRNLVYTDSLVVYLLLVKEQMLHYDLKQGKEWRISLLLKEPCKNTQVHLMMPLHLW